MLQNGLTRIIHQKMMNNDDKQLNILFLSCLCQGNLDNCKILITQIWITRLSFKN